MNKAKLMLKSLESNTITETSLKEIRSGTPFTAKDIGRDDLDSLDDETMFTCDIGDILEAHIYDPDILAAFGDKHVGVGSWPVIEKVDTLLRLESSFGSGKESYLIVSKARIAEAY